MPLSENIAIRYKPDEPPNGAPIPDSKNEDLKKEEGLTDEEAQKEKGKNKDKGREKPVSDQTAKAVIKQVENLFDAQNQTSKNIELLNEQLEKLRTQIASAEAQDDENSEAIKQLTQELSDTLISYNSAVEAQGNLVGQMAILVVQNQEAANRYLGLLQRQVEQSEATNPEALRVPTPETAARTLIERGEVDKAGEIEDESSSEYHEIVSEWFEDRLRHLESYDQTFEEHSWLLQPLELAVTRFELNSETKKFANELREKLEARRVRQRMVRIWYLATPDQIFQESPRLTTPILKELFTYKSPYEKDTDKGFLVAEEFRNYERIGQENIQAKNGSKAAKELGNENEEKRLKKIADIKKKEAFDYFKHGGYLLDEDGNSIDRNGNRVFDINGNQIAENSQPMLMDEYLTYLEDNDGSKEEIDSVREKIWARKFVGGLWSITQRAAYYDIGINGSGDFYSSRLMNFVDRLEGDALVRKTKGIWKPENGPQFDLGYRDFFTQLLGNVKIKDFEVPTGPHPVEQNEKSFNEDRIEDLLGDVEVKTNVVIGKDSSKNKLVLDEVTSLADADLQNPDFWRTLDQSYGVGENAYNLHMYGQMVADATRKTLLGYGSFFHSPSLRTFLKLGEVFDHKSSSETELITTNVGGVEILAGDRIGRPIEVAQRQVVFQDLLERTLKWGKSKDGGELLEQWKIFPEAEMFSWIENVDDEEMVTREQRDFLLKKYLSTPIISPLSPETGAKFKSTISLLMGPIRYGPFRTMIAFGTLSEFFKRAFKYIFG